MKALVICPACGYQVIGVDRDPDQAARTAIAGMQIHQDRTHGIPMTPDRFRTATRIGEIQH